MDFKKSNEWKEFYRHLGNSSLSSLTTFLCCLAALPSFISAGSCWCCPKLGEEEKMSLQAHTMHMESGRGPCGDGSNPDRGMNTGAS